MAVTIQAVMCLTILCLAFVEGRRHNLRILRKHRIQEVPDRDTLISTDEEQYIRHHRHHIASHSSGESSENEIKDPHQADVIEVKVVYDDTKELRHLSRHHHRYHEQMKPYNREKHHESLHQVNSDPLDLVKEDAEGYNYADMEDVLFHRTRGKRNNRRRPWTEKDKKSFISSRIKSAQLENERVFEMEVREAQNSSLCNYTVIPIPDPGGRIPRELEHVKCNHAGSKCQDKGTYCCIQTYQNIEVAYESGKREIIKVYSGCVCSLRIYGTLPPYNPDLDIDD